jgi:quaternary ammonium compound-resistance protein SugE
LAWFFLTIAGLLEIAWAVGLKFTKGFTVPWPSAGTIIAMIFSIVFLAQAVKTLPIGTAYAVWTGIGAVGTAIIGMAFLGESRHLMRISCIALIVVGIVGLKLSSAE